MNGNVLGKYIENWNSISQIIHLTNNLWYFKMSPGPWRDTQCLCPEMTHSGRFSWWTQQPLIPSSRSLMPLIPSSRSKMPLTLSSRFVMPLTLSSRSVMLLIPSSRSKMSLTLSSRFVMPLWPLHPGLCCPWSLHPGLRCPWHFHPGL